MRLHPCYVALALVLPRSCCKCSYQGRPLTIRTSLIKTYSICTFIRKTDLISQDILNEDILMRVVFNNGVLATNSCVSGAMQ